MPGIGFIIFWIFLIYFSKFSCPGRVWTEYGTKIFSLLFIVSHPVLAKKIAGKRFYNFRLFLIFFWEFSCPGRVWTEFGIKIFFFSLFYPISLSLWLKIMPGRGFFIFQIFCYFFRNFLARVEYKRNSGLKFFSHFLSLTHQDFAKNNVGKRFFYFFNFFTIFFGIFLPGSTMNGIRD